MNSGNAISLQYKKYEFTRILGWSISRFEVFDTCKRQYFYTYYSKYVPGIPAYKIARLRELTSVPLEIGHIVHDVIEAFLRRLQKSTSNIDEKRFFEYAQGKAEEYFSHKTFLETYYRQVDVIDIGAAEAKISKCLDNFIGSPVYSWIFMKALYNRDSWMIEPEGFGETRLNGLKAYCKMDFLFPVDDHIHILDWKTGKKDEYKHTNQLIGYAAAASSNFSIPRETIYPKIVYLYPVFDEFEVALKETALDDFFEKVKEQTGAMYALCEDPETNTPLPIDAFPMTPSTTACRYCNFQELCFPDCRKQPDVPAFD